MAGLIGGETRRRKGVENLDNIFSLKILGTSLLNLSHDPSDHHGGSDHVSGALLAFRASGHESPPGHAIPVVLR
jgi:hypothetical protein